MRKPTPKNRVYIKWSAPGLSPDGRYAVLYVDWTDYKSIAGEWWLFENRRGRWVLKAKDRKLLAS